MLSDHVLKSSGTIQCQKKTNIASRLLNGNYETSNIAMRLPMNGNYVSFLDLFIVDYAM